MSDSLWKDIIQNLFTSFAEFFLPDLFPLINFERQPEFLDKEFSKLFPKSKEKNRRGDKLVKVFLKDGTERWLLIHIEIQAYHDEAFADRMFATFYRIYEKLGKRITALAVFTDEKKGFKPDRLVIDEFGTGLTYHYRVYKVLEQDENILKKSDNPFALVILASLYAIRSKRSEDKKLKFKLELVKLLMQRDYSPEEIYGLFDFIDVVIRQKDLAKEELFLEEVEKMARTEKKIEVIGSYKKIAIMRAEQEALQKGEQLGLQKGKIEEGISLLSRLLKKKFKKLPKKLEEKLKAVKDPGIIERIAEEIFDLESPEQVMAMLESQNG